MRVLVVEDEMKVANALREGLEGEKFEVIVERTGEGAFFRVNTESFDVILLDLTLPGRDGLEILQALRQRGVKAPVLVLTARDSLQDRVTGLDAGADDYLIKPFHMPELISRVRALLRRPNAALGVVLDLDELILDTVSRQAKVGEIPLVLSLRETALLELLLRRQGNVVTREAIEHGLYGFDTTLGSNAVEVLVQRLRRKLGEAGARVAVHTLRGVGYLLGAVE